MVSVQLQLVFFVQKQIGIQWNAGSTVVLFGNMYFYCTYSIKTKILSMLGTGYFQEPIKIWWAPNATQYFWLIWRFGSGHITWLECVCSCQHCYTWKRKSQPNFILSTKVLLTGRKGCVCSRLRENKGNILSWFGPWTSYGIRWS